MMKSIFKASLYRSKYANNLFNLSMKASGSSHHPASDEPEIKRFDPIKYTRKLNAHQRKEEGMEVPLFDTINDKPGTIFNKQNLDMKPSIYVEMMKPVLIPFESSIERTNTNFLDRSEIEARIFNILRQFDFLPLDKIDLDAHYEKDLGLDSLDWTALLTSIEYEFNTIFNDTFYEHWTCINDVILHLEKDDLIF
jgi:acyl carrier protein